MPTLPQTLKKLEALGSEQTRKIYRRHGAGDNLYGVSFANLGKLQKEIKTDHALAEELWATGNFDAMTLAAMIADPQAMKAADLERWVKDICYYCLADVFVRYTVSKSPHARKLMEKWTQSKDEWIGRAGWDLLALLAMADHDLPDDYFEKYLDQIEQRIHQAKNMTRYAMNGALIGIGIRNDRLRKQAIAASGRIGKVEVDHGETSCQTPDAVAYIEKVIARRKAKK